MQSPSVVISQPKNVDNSLQKIIQIAKGETAIKQIELNDDEGGGSRYLINYFFIQFVTGFDANGPL
jgi:hypothetical protein